MKLISILFTLVFLTFSMSLHSQLTVIGDPAGTNITEVDPFFPCGAPYDNVPIARSTGKTWQFENGSWSSNIFWGPDNTIENLMDGNDFTFPLCDNLDDVNFDAGQSNLSSGIIIYTGFSNYPVISTKPIRLTFEVKTYPGGVGIVLDNTTYPGQIVFEVTENFQVNVLIEANNTTGGVTRNSDACYPGGTVPTGWHPAVELFDMIHCLGSNCKASNTNICTSFDRAASLPFYSNCSGDNTFDGGNGTSVWDDPANWTEGCVPISPVSGNITIAADCFALGSGAMVFNGDFTIDPTISFTNDDPNVWTMNGVIDNNGTMVAGTMSFSNPFTNDGVLSGVIDNDLINYGTFTGSVTGTCTNHGIVSPGN